MFGNNTTSTWGNTNQNQQQQQQQPANAFGQPQTNAFGAGSTFGTGAFGTQQQQQQQPAQPVNPMFGGATTTTTPASTGFGAFGNTATSAFGAKPAGTGFGAFGGGTSTFGGGGSAFGNTNTANTTSAFGQPSTTGGAFGGSTLFGATKPAAPTGAFGSVSNTATAGASGDTIVPPVTTGSVNPPYNVFQEKDTSGTTAVNLHYQSISAMPAYRGTSFEEIRVQDYAQGRKTAQTSGFGQTPSVFGATQPTTSVFGQPAAPTTTFGAFGQANQPAQQQQQQQQTTTGFGAFGQPAAAAQPSAFGGGTTGFGGFGQQQNQAQPAQGSSLFGGFGANNQQQQQQQQQQPAQGTSNVFGSFGANNNNQPKPFGTFGSTGTNTFGTGGAFGQNTQQQTQPASTGLFGQTSTQPAQTSAFGGFGAANNNNQPKPSIFGNTTTTQPATSGGFGGIFGQNQNQQQQTAQPQTSLFGSTNNAGGGLFGQNQNQQQAQPGQTQPAQPSGGLFGNTQQTQPPASGGLFGGGGLFGNNQQKPAFGTGLFGNTATNAGATNNTATQPQNSLFGQNANQSTAQPAGASTFGTSLFGNKPATSTFGQSLSQPAANTGTSLFGNSLGGTGGGLFGSTNNAQQNQPTLTASVAQPVSTNLPIFSLLQSGPQSAPVNPPPKKQSSYFVDVPTRSPLGLSVSRNMGASKLRGFGYSQSTNRNTIGGFSNSLSHSSNHTNPLQLSGIGGGKSLLGPESFLGTSTLGSDGRPSPKKLVLDKKMDPNEVFGKSFAQQKSSPASAGPKVAFNPAMSAALREKESLAASSASAATPGSPAAKKSNSLGAADFPRREKGPDELQDGEYWVKPSLDVLRNTSNEELSQFKGLTVGRKGYGEVQFLEPVDLTALPRLSALLGKIVQIDNKECCVYPDAVDGANDDLKPPPGEGVNVKARIILYGCWPVDKATREPIKDESHPSFPKHLKRLKGMKHTHFESYSIEDGKWTFTVEHF
ncbi:hypothetical protein SCHPADRAFT_844526 [Schizopora paradoxa]|uniref:Peptidase S59 domain-containing protein n=1 Tax=Schizopora paradoxa TaxID=27342 RepID=A0A0H2S3N9_9AGAM|nr:hypothetical protein SCHPADRAFT_844526 [Schizopora paradoxa]